MWALRLAASLLHTPAQAPEWRGLAAAALEQVRRHPANFHVLACTADVLAAAKAVGGKLPVEQLLVCALVLRQLPTKRMPLVTLVLSACEPLIALLLAHKLSWV